MTAAWFGGRRNRERRRRRNGESRDNRRSFDFAQDDTFLVMGMGMRHRWLTADSSAALRNDKQKSRDDKQKLRNDKVQAGQRQMIRRWLRLELRCVPVLPRRPRGRDRCWGRRRRGVRSRRDVLPGLW